MYSFLLIIHIIICILLIIVVLFQAGKKFGLSGLVGGGSSDALISGSGGNSLLKTITSVIAVLFLITSISLTVLTSKRSNKSLMSDIMPPAPLFPETTSNLANSNKVVNSTQTK